MAILGAIQGSNRLLSMRVLLMSTGVLSAAVFLKLSAPLIFEFAVSDVPFLYGSFISWLRPPYLYILINFIIMSIVASSKLHHKTDGDASPPEVVSQPPHPQVKVTDYAVLDGVVTSGYEYVTAAPVDIQIDDVVRDVEPVPETIYAPLLEEARVLERKLSDDVVTVNGGDLLTEKARDPPLTPPRRTDSVEFFSNWNEKENAKPPVSSRFSHRKSLKSSPEEKGLRRVSKPKRQETLESTWRTITEGRAMPLARHLKKSDTLESHARRVPGQDDPNPDPMMKKSETFQDRSNGTAPSRSGSGKLKKEASLSQDELNRRVEAFIKKFNEEMRLQRQESLNQYQEMIGRGAH